MNRKHLHSITGWILLVCGLLIVVSCAETGRVEKKAENPPEAEKEAESRPPEETGSGSTAVARKLWDENCKRCHSLASVSDEDRDETDWNRISRHMNQRSDLKKKEHRALLQFLKKTN